MPYSISKANFMLDRLVVHAASGSQDATLTAGKLLLPAKLGRGGLLPPGQTKKEGDGTTPQGAFGLRQLYYRPDRENRPHTHLPVIRLSSDDLWCDDPAHPLYNRPVKAPFTASHEVMWRDDRAYDLVIVLDFNLLRPEPGQGSAIFFHLTKADENPPPTAGCVAVTPDTMRLLLPQLSLRTQMVIETI